MGAASVVFERFEAQNVKTAVTAAFPALGEELPRDILHLRPHEEGRREAHGASDAQLLGQCVRVVKEDEVGLPLPAICKIPSAEILGEKDRGPLPLRQAAKVLLRQRFPLPGAGRQAKVHPQPLNVQRQTGRTPLGRGGLLKVLRKIPPGDGGAQQRDARRRGPGVALRQVQRPPSGGQGLPQPLHKGQPVPSGPLLKIQQDAAVPPPSALPQHRRAQCLGVLDQGRLPVTDGQQTAPCLEQQVLPQHGGARADAVGHMGEGAAVLPRLPQFLRCHSQIGLQCNLPLVQMGLDWYTM